MGQTPGWNARRWGMGTRGSGQTRKTEDQMYLDHHAVQRIAHILEQIDNPALLMDDGGNVL